MWCFALFMEKEEGGGRNGNKYPRSENLDALSPQQTRVQRRQGSDDGCCVSQAWHVNQL